MDFYLPDSLYFWDEVDSSKSKEEEATLMLFLTQNSDLPEYTSSSFCLSN